MPAVELDSGPRAPIRAGSTFSRVKSAEPFDGSAEATAAAVFAARRLALARAAVRYALAAAGVAAVLGIKLALVPWVEHDTPFLLFFAAVLVAGWYAGIGPGLLATGLATAASAYFFMAPYQDLRVSDPVQRVRLAVFTAEALFISNLAAFHQRARRRVDMATEEARRLERQILRASDNARRLVGHDLHDGLGQHLAGAAFRARFVVRRLEAERHALSADARVVEELLSRSVAWTRELAAGLSPTGVRADGLPAALAELAAQTERAFGVRCVSHADGDDVARGLTAESASHLYLIAREATGNAARHARPGVIRITLACTRALLVLTVEDDGSGTAAPRSGGNGMYTMNYRAQIVGARLEVRPLSPHGTSVTCFCPRRIQ
jgi:signal transduction histidine kinase